MGNMTKIIVVELKVDNTREYSLIKVWKKISFYRLVGNGMAGYIQNPLLPICLVD